MTGYKSKKAAAQAKTIDEVNWADHEPNGLAQPAQEPVAYLCKPDQHGLFDIPTPDKACKDCFPVYTTPPQPAQAKVEGPIHVVCQCDKCKAQPAQEPAAQYSDIVSDGGLDPRNKFDAQPQQRPWVGLTDEDIKAVNAQVSQIPPIDYTTTTYAKAIEAKLKEKNNAT